MSTFRILLAATAICVAQSALAIRPNAPKMPLPENATAIQEQEEALKQSHFIFVPGACLDSLNKDSIRNTIEMFYIDQFRNFQDPKVPYFLLMSKDSKVAMGVGGAVRMRGWADFAGSIPANGFYPYLIPVPANPMSRKGIGATPAGTAIFLRVVGRDLPVGDLIAYVEGKFDGYDNVGFKVKKAYVTMNDWTIGYAPTTFSDPMAQVPTIDGAQPNSYISHTTVLARYLHSFKKHWSVAASLEFPANNSFVATNYAAPQKGYVPDISAFLQYEWRNGAGHVRLSGLARVLSYRNLTAQKNHSVAGWGVHLSTMIPVTYGLTLYGNVNTGRGYASYMGDLSTDELDLIASVHNPSEMYAPMILGGCVGVRYNFLPNVYACAAFSESRMLPKNSGLCPADMFKYGIYGVANVFWDITPRISVGAEYLHGVRKNMGGEHAAANRVDAFFQFSF